MEKLVLESNEAIIIKEESAYRGSSKLHHEVILTNINFIIIEKGILSGKSKRIIKYPLNQIKLVNGIPQVRIGRNNWGNRALEFYFFGGIEVISFDTFGKQKYNKWIEEINKIFSIKTGHSIPNNYQESELESFFGVLKDAKKQIKSLFGSHDEDEEDSNVPITVACISCKAPISGLPGQTIKCMYCDTEQTIRK